MQEIERLINKARKKVKILIFRRSLIRAAIFANCCYIAGIITIRLIFPAFNLQLLFYTLAGITLLWPLLKIYKTRISLQDVALQLDISQGLQERLSSAMAISQNNRVADAVRQDAWFHLQKIDIHEAFPFWDRQTRILTLVATILLSVAIIFFYYFPAKDILGWGQEYLKKQQIAQNKEAVAKKLAQSIKAIRKKFPQLKHWPNLKMALKEMEDLARQLNQKKFEEQRHDIARMTQMLAKMKAMEEKSLEKLEDLNEIFKQELLSQNLKHTRSLKESLEKGDLDKTSQELKKLGQKLKKLMKKKLKKKQNLTQEEKKELEELQKEIDKLRKALNQDNQLARQLQKTLQDISKYLSKTKELDQLVSNEQQQQELQKMLQGLQDPQKLLKELQNYAKQLKTLEQMYASIDECRQCLANNGSGIKPSQIFPSGQGQGQKQGNLPTVGQTGQMQGIKTGNQGNQQGQGLIKGQQKGKGGGLPPESKDGKNNWSPLQVKGKNFEGKIIAEFKFRGDAPRGQARAAYQDYARAMIKEAESSISGEKNSKRISRLYQRVF